MRPGHREHRLDALLDTGQLEAAPRGGRLPVQVHQAPDRRAVDVGHLGQVEEDLLLAVGQQGRDRPGEVAEEGVHEPRLGDADDGNAAGSGSCLSGR